MNIHDVYVLVALPKRCVVAFCLKVLVADCREICSLKSVVVKLYANTYIQVFPQVANQTLSTT